MANILFKKSFQLRNFTEIPYADLWNKNGIFTTIRILGKRKKYLFINEHLKNFNLSLKKFSINFKINKYLLNKLIKKEFKKDVNYDHLLRIAVNNQIISFSLRKRLVYKKNFKATLFCYQRSNYKFKNLKYKKLLNQLQKINTRSEEIILFKKNRILEGSTTNIICAKKNKLFIPINGYYKGITLQFFLKQLKRKIIKKNITKKNLQEFDEILLVGSGKGVVAVENIPQIHWYKKENKVFNKFQRIYNSYINKNIAI